MTPSDRNPGDDPGEAQVAGGGPAAVPDAGGSGTPGLLRRGVRWIVGHKIRTLLILAAVFVGGELTTIPWCGVAALKHENPPETALMRQRRREAEREKRPYPVTQRWIALSRIPRHVIDAVVVAEDGTFFSHGGIDWFEVRESAERNWREGRAARGASTITQQLAKNLFLSTSKDPLRKGKEVIITLLCESQLSKERILELYLNVIEWGRGIYGIEAASQAFFRKSATALTVEEGARLAAVIPSPLRHRPDSDSRYVLRRKEIVLGRLEARGVWRQQPASPDTMRPVLEFPPDSSDMELP